MKRLVRNTLISLLLALAAVPALAAYDMVPCAVGNRWEYDCNKLVRANITLNGKPLAVYTDAAAGSSIYEVTAVDKNAEKPLYTYRLTTVTHSSNGTDDTSKNELKLSSEADGLHLHSVSIDRSDEKPTSQLYNPPLFYYAKSAESGKAWEIGTVRDEDITTLVAGKGAERETITVPAGTFKNCLKVIMTSNNISGTVDIWDKKFTITSGQVRDICWVAEGIGLVKELEVETSTAETPGPGGKPIQMESTSCTVTELRPGYVIK